VQKSLIQLNNGAANSRQNAVWRVATHASALAQKLHSGDRKVLATIQPGVFDGKDRRRRDEIGEGKRGQVC
jgi:hypothetical protein